MRIVLQSASKWRFVIPVPLGFFATRPGAYLAARLYNAQLRQKKSKPAASMPSAAKSAELLPIAQNTALAEPSCAVVSAAQLQHVFLCLKQSCHEMKRSGIPLFEASMADGVSISVKP